MYRFTSRYESENIEEEFELFPHEHIYRYIPYDRIIISGLNDIKVRMKMTHTAAVSNGSTWEAPDDNIYGVYYDGMDAHAGQFYRVLKIERLTAAKIRYYGYPVVRKSVLDITEEDYEGQTPDWYEINYMSTYVTYAIETTYDYEYELVDLTPRRSVPEEFVTLNGLKKYDHKKGTAEVDVSSLPLTPEHRVYVKHDNDKTLETVWAKDVEVATEYDVQNNIEYVNAAPSSDITSKIYGIVGVDGSFSCTENSMESQTDAMKVFFDFTNGTVKLPIKYNGNAIYTFAKPDTVYEFYDDHGTKVVDLTNAITLNYTEYNKYYAGDLTNQTATELATADAVKAAYIPLSQKAKANGVATLDANGRLPTSQLPTEALVYKGTWDASTGTFPTGTFTPGDFYVVSVAGTISGVDYAVGDWIIYSQHDTWELLEGSSDVHSVNGKTGVVVLKDEDIDTAALPTGSTVEYYTPATDTIQDALIKHDNELTNQDTRLDRIEAETNAEHTKQVTFFTDEASIPTTTTDTFLFGVGEYAYAIDEQTWWKLTAIDSTTKALTWTQVDVGIAVPYTAGEGIDITNNTITNTSRVWEGTQAEYNALTPAQKVGIALFIITDSVGQGVTVEDVVEDGNLNAVTSNAVYDAIQGIADNSTAVEYVSAIPVSNIKDRIYGVEQSGGASPKFYAGDADNQSTYKLGGSDIFVGTQAEWDALTTAQKNEYSQADITDTSSVVHVPVDVIADGNMNPVTSNAVYDALNPTRQQITLTASVGTLTYSQVWRIGNVVQGQFAISFANGLTADTTDLVTGLPKPAIGTLMYEIGVIEATQAVCRTVITTTGIYRDWYNQIKPTSGQQVTYYVNYVCTDD